MVAGMVHSISSARAEAMPSRSLAAYAVKNLSMVASWDHGHLKSAGEVGDLALGQSQRRSGNVFLEMRQRRGAGDRQHHRRALKEPRDRHLCRGRAVRICHPLMFLRSREPARPERKTMEERRSRPAGSAP
jgi:hypothetical protein